MLVTMEVAYRESDAQLSRKLAKFEQFRSFSAVSAPIFARKYAFCSVFQNLPDYPADNFEIWQYFALYFANFATFAKNLLNFHEIC